MVHVSVRRGEFHSGAIFDRYDYLGLDGVLAPYNQYVIETATESLFGVNANLFQLSLYFGYHVYFTPTETFSYGEGGWPTGSVSSLQSGTGSNVAWSITGVQDLNLTPYEILSDPSLVFQGDDIFEAAADIPINDWFNTGDGNDSAFTYAGDDIINLGRGNGLADGGGDADVLMVDFSDRDVAIEYVHNDQAATFLVGGQAAVQALNIERIEVLCGAGYDLVTGGSGDDVIRLGLGGGYANGGAGFDLVGVDFSDQTQGVVLTFNGSTFSASISGAPIAGGEAVEAIEIVGGSGDDQFTGSSLGDFIFGGAGNDIINGAGGWDVVFAQGNSPFRVDLAILTAQDTGQGFDIFIAIEEVRGAGGNDQISGNEISNRLLGGDGDDFLDGREDRDVLIGGAGSDTLIGGDGDDWILAAPEGVFFGSYDPTAGTNFIDAGAGADTVFGDNGDDIIHGGAGDDNISGLGGANLMYGDDGNDIVNGYDNDDTIYGGAGNDILYGLPGSDRLYGGDGNDTLSGDHYVTGLVSNDYLNGGDGDDVLRGDIGDDVLVGCAGRDRIDGGWGFDTADYSEAPAGVVVSLAVVIDFIADTGWQDTGGAGVDQLIAIERVIGSAFDDVLTAAEYSSAAGSVLEGGGGDDQLWGRWLNDTLIGGAGSDALSGGEGVDASVYSVASTSATWVRNANGSWTVTAGAEGMDTLTTVEVLDFSDRDVVLDNASRTFSGDGTSDLMWRNATTGAVAVWEMAGAVQTNAYIAGGAPNEWTVLGTGD
ncbi:MAG: hypothetical protein JNM59_09895, partial [Hyphomonadaceae bacterium]|nr:hypothetical protein [Hyphomonadaceae bacterium]